MFTAFTTFRISAQGQPIFIFERHKRADWVAKEDIEMCNSTFEENPG